MKKIALSQGQFALVDDTDFEFLSQWKWYFHKNPKDRTGYAIRMGEKDSFGRRSRISMHRVLLGLRRGQVGDHINRNGLDNRRCNLRVVTVSQSMTNRVLPRSGKHSAYPGVGCVDGKYWTARVTVQGKRKYLGAFPTAEQAYAARCAAATVYHV